MKRITLALGVAALATGIAGAAVAQQQMARMGPHDPFGNATITRAEAQAKAAEIFAKMDLNGDGRLDQADRAVMIGRRFDAMDANHDGVLSRQEFIDAHQRMMGADADHGAMAPGMRGDGPEGRHLGMRHRGMGMMGLMGMMRGMDANGDHAITREEFIGGMLRRFDAADTNHDGRLTPEERRAAFRQGMREHMEHMRTMGPDHAGMDDAPPPPAH